jgi:hypothetical protein
LFNTGEQEETKQPANIDDPIEIDPRNSEAGIGFIDVMGFKIYNTKNKIDTNWQNLWLRFATD